MSVRVAITGLGIVAPNAHGVHAFEDALRSGRSGISHHHELKTLNFECQIAGIPAIAESTYATYFRPDYRRTTNSGIRFALIAALDCWKDAGFGMPDPRGNDVDYDTGVVIGTGVGGGDTFLENVFPAVRDCQIRKLGSTIPERIMVSGAASKVADYLALGGHVWANSSACTTGTESLLAGFREIREGRALRVLAGSTEGANAACWAGFDSMRVLARGFNATPELASRPLSATAAGFVPAAGAGVVLLESLEHARGRGARIYAELLGGAVNCGGFRSGGSMTAPGAIGVRRCLEAAVSDASVDITDIDLISGHLTGTFADASEIENWNAVFDEHLSDLPYINAPKALFGHALGAAGAIESVAVILQIASGFIHGTPTSDDILPQLAHLRERIPLESLGIRPRVVAKSSFGFGDVNACLLFKQYSGGIS